MFDADVPAVSRPARVDHLEPLAALVEVVEKRARGRGEVLREMPFERRSTPSRKRSSTRVSSAPRSEFDWLSNVSTSVVDRVRAELGEIGVPRLQGRLQRLGPLVQHLARTGDRRLQRIGAVAEIAFQRQQPLAEALVDLHHPVGDRLGQIVRADLQLVAQRLQPAVERGRHLAVAVMEGGGHFARARDQRLADLPGARIERGVDALQPVVERVGETVGALREVVASPRRCGR